MRGEEKKKKVLKCRGSYGSYATSSRSRFFQLGSVDEGRIVYPDCWG
jgi:hypothetical protein